MKNLFIKTSSALIIVGVLYQFSSAQQFLFQTQPKDKSQFGIRFLKPNFEDDLDFTTFSGTYDLYANIPLGKNFNLMFSLPYSTYADDEESESEVGDIYLGLQSRKISGRNTNSTYSLGIFLPTASEDDFTANFISMLANYYQVERYLPNTLTIYGNYAHQIKQASGALFSFEIGPTLLFPTDQDEGEDRETELMMHYGLSAGFQFGKLAILGELVGLAFITEDVDDFSDRFIHTLTFGAQGTGRVINPGLFYSIYLKDEFREFVDGILGIKVDVTL